MKYALIQKNRNKRVLLLLSQTNWRRYSLANKTLTFDPSNRAPFLMVTL